MNLKLPQLLALTVGAVLLYAAIKNVSPTAVIKAALTGQPMPTAADNALPPWTQVTDAQGNPDGGINGKGQYIPRTDQNTPQPQTPAVPGGQTNVPTAYKAPYTVVSV